MTLLREVVPWLAFKINRTSSMGWKSGCCVESPSTSWVPSQPTCPLLAMNQRLKTRPQVNPVVNQITWPLELIYTPALESQNIKARMLTHLQEIMEDREAY